MSSFTRYAAVAAVVISLGFLVSAAPAFTYAEIPVITGKDPVSVIFAQLCIGIDDKIKALLACANIAQLEVAVKALVPVFQACADALLKVDAGVAVDVEAKASIVACMAAIITLLVQVCVQVSLKFGVAVVATIFAQIDVVVRLCLVNLNICIDGILVLVANALASVTVGLLAKLDLKLCLSVLGL